MGPSINQVPYCPGADLIGLDAGLEVEAQADDAACRTVAIDPTRTTVSPKSARSEQRSGGLKKLGG